VSSVSRPGPIAVVALVAAVLGGAVVLAVGEGAGWLGGHSSTIVYRSVAPAPEIAAPAAVGPVAKPLTGGSFNPARIYAARSPGVVTIFAVYGSSTDTAQTAQGSGFVVSQQGYILTNSHVVTTAGEGNSGAVKAADRVYVEFKNHDRVVAKVAGWDVFDDVALVKVDPSAHALDPVPLGDSAAARVGEPVAAIGSPFGNENSLAVGVVSATARSIRSLTSPYNLVDAIQTDAPINHGNSGGPLFDARGQVIGINAQIRSSSGNADGVGFAVPINSARRSMEQLIATGHVAYAYAGITTEDLTPSLARRFGLRPTVGALIDTVNDKTPAAAAGLRGGNREERVLGSSFTRGGDLIVAIDGYPVRSGEDVVRIVTERLAPGQVARFTIVRDGKRRDVPVRLTTRPLNPQ
jgi:S1-C subfamily serine protease